MNSNKKTWQNLLYFVTGIVVLVALLNFFTAPVKPADTPINTSEIITAINQGKVSKITISEEGVTTVSLFKDDSKDKNNTVPKIGPSFVGSELQFQESLATTAEKLGSKIEPDKINQIEFKQEKASFWAKHFADILNVVLLVGGLIFAGYFFLKMVQSTNNRSISFGQTNAKTFESETGPKVTFADVAGAVESKGELFEIVDFLKRPQEYFEMGARIPRGLLMTGAPGVGKTLMARAVAGEAGVPFLYLSGSEFVEMFVGVGASRVRDLFKKAKKLSPCIIFIDEIDAVGRQRGTGLGGGNDEREQTLNQILVEMDGFDNTTPVIVIAATNRPDVLDPALLRPGRFDRQIQINLPDLKERIEILKVHSKNKKFADDINLEIVAKRTPGFSGADLMNVLNEGAILAVRHGLKLITNNVLREAIEKVVLGPSLVSKVIKPEDKKLTAYHEAGHALVATILQDADKVQKITIIPRGRAGGYNFFASEDRTTKTKSQFLAEIAVLFGGYTTEKIIYGQMSTGASNDLQVATGIARKMVMKYGMSDMGPVSFDDDRGMNYLGKDIMQESKHYSEETSRRIDSEISKIISDSAAVCHKVISENRQYLDRIANKLIDQEVLEYEEFVELVYDILPQSEKDKYHKEMSEIDKQVKDKKDNQAKSDKNDGAPKSPVLTEAKA